MTTYAYSLEYFDGVNPVVKNGITVAKNYIDSVTKLCDEFGEENIIEIKSLSAIADADIPLPLEIVENIVQEEYNYEY